MNHCAALVTLRAQLLEQQQASPALQVTTPGHRALLPAGRGYSSGGGRGQALQAASSGGRGTAKTRKQYKAYEKLVAWGVRLGCI